jgi:NADPH-dependent 2,4-dienoyl-CoA reductase/sulfur reductase-like enzyme
VNDPLTVVAVIAAFLIGLALADYALRGHR